MYRAIDGLQLVEALQELERAGFRANGQVRPGGQVRCGACGRDSAATGLEVALHARIEGVSDPSDEMLVVGVRCPTCKALGTLVLGYGSRVGRDEAEVLRGLGFLGSVDTHSLARST